MTRITIRLTPTEYAQLKQEATDSLQQYCIERLLYSKARIVVSGNLFETTSLDVFRDLATSVLKDDKNIKQLAKQALKAINGLIAGRANLTPETSQSGFGDQT